MASHSNSSHWEMFKDGLIRGIGWSFGVTIGFAVISSLLVFLLNSFGGVPLVGERIADLVEATQISLEKR